MESNKVKISTSKNNNLSNSGTLWTNEDIKYLYDNYYFTNLEELSSYLGRPISAIKRKKVKLPIENFRRPNMKNIRWSEEDINFILNNKNMPINELANYLNRTIGSVKKKKYSLANHKKDKNKIEAKKRKDVKSEWTKEDILFLKENFTMLTNKEISDKLNRSINAIKIQKRQLGLINQNKVSWTPEEVEYLKSNFKLLSEKNMASKLNKSISSIYRKKKELGLRCDLAKWSKEEDAYLDIHWGFLTVNQLSKKLNRAPSTIIKRANTLSLGPLYRSGLFFTTFDVAKLIGTYTSTIISWIKKGYLKVSMRQLNTRKMYLIKPENLLEFLKNYPSLWDSKYLEFEVLGPEEPWLTEKRILDSKKPFKKKRKK